MPTPRRLRKSIGVHTELSNPHKENATLDVGQSLAASRKSRSKSIGPGGLDALRQGNGNRRAVWNCFSPGAGAQTVAETLT